MAHRVFGDSKEADAQQRSSGTIKKDANKSLNLLIKQYDKLNDPDNMILKGADFESQSNRAQFEQQSQQLQANIGRGNLAGSGTASRARENLATAFQSKQMFTREKALDEQESSLDNITMEMQNIINTTRSSLQGMQHLNRSERTYTPPDLSAYGIED